MGLKFQVPSFAPRLYFIFRESGGAVGPLGYGEPDIWLQARKYLGHRLRRRTGQGKSLVHVGAELTLAGDSLVQHTQGNFTDALKPFATSLTLRASRQRPLPLEEARMRQQKLMELRRLAAAPRPDTCARLAQLAAREVAFIDFIICKEMGESKDAEVYLRPHLWRIGAPQ